MTAAYTLNPAIAFQRVGDDAILLHIESGEYYGLNDTGALMLEELTAHGDLEQAVARVCATYDVSAEVARADAEQLLAALLRAGLLLPTAG